MDRTDSRAAKNGDVVSDTSRLVDVRESGRELVSSERVWSGPIFAVDADHVRLTPGQDPVARQVVVHHDAVAVVALREGEDSSQPDGAAEILMVRQYRHPVRAMLWEIPAGLLDVGRVVVAVAVAQPDRGHEPGVGVVADLARRQTGAGREVADPHAPSLVLAETLAAGHLHRDLDLDTDVKV